ncbi:MAG TPA: translocation/assembly module TamB domain-containing protein [Steroidobacteraceae bacterium]
MRRLLRIGAWTAGSVLLLIVALAAAVLVAGNTAGGRAVIERGIGRLTDDHVRLSGLSGSFPAHIDLEQLQLSDEGGTWLTAERLSLHWSPVALLARHVKVGDLRIARLDIERRPQSEPSQKGGTSLPRIDVQRLSIDTLELGPQLAGARASLSVQGTAHLISLEDAAATVSARRTDDAHGGDYQLTLRFDPSRMDASLKIEEPAGGALENVLGYPGLGALSVVAQLSGPRSAERVQVTARAGALRAGVQGSIDLGAQSADLTYSLDAPTMTPRPGLSWQRIALQGSWHGVVTAPRADGRLQIDALQIPGGTGVAALDANLNADRGVFAVHAVAEGLQLPGPQPRLLAQSPLRVDATMHLSEGTRPLQLTAEHRLFSLQARAVTAGAQSATFDLRLPDLAPLAAIAGQRLRGKAELKATVKQSSARTHLDVDADTQLADGTTLLAKVLGGASRLQLAATLTDRTVDVERLRLNGRTLSVSASGNGQRGTTSAAPAVQSLRARYEVSVSNVTVLSAALAGTVRLNGQIDGPANSLTTQAQLTSSLSIRGSARETIQASIKARGLPSLANATLQARGRLAGAPLQLDASLERGADDTFHVAVQRSEWKSARLEGDLTTAANMTPGHGSLRLRIDRLVDLQPLLGTSIVGSIEGSLALRPVDRHSYAQLRLDAQNIVAANLSANARLIASGPIDALSLQLSLQSRDVLGEPASLATAARLNLAAHELNLQRAEARYHGQSLRLLAPARLSFAEGLAIRKLKLGVQRAVIELDGSVSPTLALRASAHRVDAALVNAFVPGVLAQGTLDVDAQLEGSTSAPSGLVTVKAAGLRAASTTARDLRAVDVHATARVKANTAQLEAQLSAGRASQLTLTGSAPLSADGALNLKLDGKLDAALANPMLEARGERVAGALTVNAALSGTPRSPEINGTVDIAHGDLRDYGQGVHLTDITAHLIASQGTVRIASLTASAPPGQLSMTGAIGVLQPKLPVDLQLTAKNAQPITSDILTANLGANLRVQGTVRERIDLSGTIDLNRTVIGIPNDLPPEVAVLDVRRPGQAPPAPPGRKLVIGLDLKLHAPREILVQGRGLNAELGGDLQLRGTTDSPRVSGGFDLIRGTFALTSTQVKFTNGRVSFNGAGLKGKIDPTLDFTAQATAADATATLRITGFADSPQFTLSSSPQLPQDEILARLLFGESASQLTALQLAQIGAALASLSGAGGGTGLNPLAKVQKRLGLDRLSVGGGSNTAANGSQSSGANVEAGRYVSDRVFVGAKQSTTGFSQVQVDVDLSKHLKLQTRLGNGTATTQGTTPENDPGSSVGVMYQFEY